MGEAPPTTAEEQNIPQGEGPSALDELRAAFAAKVAEPRLFKRFPANGGRLAGEFKPATKKEVREAAATENDEYLLSEALVRVHIEDETNPEANEYGLVPLEVWAKRPELGPLRFDNRLADLLGIPHGSPAEIELALFEGNDLALATQAGEVAQWSLDTHNETYQDFALRS